MSIDPDKANSKALGKGEIKPAHISELTRRFQAAAGLAVDGILGPVTRAALEQEGADPAVVVVRDHWLHGPGVEHVPAHASWYGGERRVAGIVAHYTATEHGTAMTMATRRIVERKPEDRAASWHITIAHDGRIVQMVPFDRVAWHCSNGRVDGRPTNTATIGIEIEGHGDAFPAAQVKAAEQVWRALVQHYAIRRELAMLEHSALDPMRRRDPGPVWMREHAPAVLAKAY